MFEVSFSIVVFLREADKTMIGSKRNCVRWLCVFDVTCVKKSVGDARPGENGKKIPLHLHYKYGIHRARSMVISINE